MSNDLSRARNLSPEEKRALLESLLRKEPAGSRVAPVSFAQQRLWFLEQMGDLGATYHVPLWLYLTGPLDEAALRRALDRIVARHEALRTTFGQVDGKPVQRIAAPGPFALARHDVRAAPDPRAALDALVRAEAEARFDLAAGPLVRGTLVRVASDEHALLITLHHIVSDGWSRGVLAHELGTLYEAFSTGGVDPLPPLPTQYADYAAWQRRRVGGELLERQGDFWAQALAGAPELLELPADHARPARQDFAGDGLPLELDAELTAALKALSRRNGATLFMTLLAGWAIVLGRLSGQADVVVGTPTANRDRREIEGLIGFFVNTLAVRVDLSGAPTVAQVLARVRARALEAQQNQDIPFEQVVERVRPARSLAYSPLFQVMFAWQNEGGGALQLPGLTVGDVEGAHGDTAKFDLSLGLWEQDGRIAGGITYATSLFQRATVERYAGYLRRVLEGMAADENQPVDRLPILPADERRLVLQALNATDRPYPADDCVHDLFRAQAARTPDAVALVHGGERVTYAALAARANRISHALRRRGAGPEVCIGICLPRTPDLVAAMLGVLGAGAAYVPLDPAYPRERLGFMVEDAAIALVVTDSVLADRLPEGTATLRLDGDADALAAESADAPRVHVHPEHLSHVIFTSGSTGRPKGVMIRHAAVAALLHWMRETVADDERAAVLFSTSVNFDVSVAELFGALCWGGTLVMVENALDLPAVAHEQIRYVSMVPTAAAELLRTGGIPASVRTVNLAGEALPAELARGLYALGTVDKVRNLYGPTEDTSYSTYALVARDGDAVLIGTPLANSQAYVLDGQLQPVPLGVAGELYLAGEGLARGYAARPGMTAERFLPCPFGPPGGRMYRTMDRARRRPDADGALEYLGRADFQVKVRGFRIELGEIESRLLEHPAVHAAVVLARQDVPGDTRLVAYVVADASVPIDGLRAHLADRLPGYMVPAAYVRMDALPQTPNGKTDRKALPAPEGDAFARGGYEAPEGETERALADVWAEVLGIDRVGRRDSFFDLGGHSLLAVQVGSRVRQALGAEIPLHEIFAAPVLADLARVIDGATRAPLPALEPADRDGRLPLSFAQQRLWFLEQLGSLGGTYHIPLRLRLRGPLDRDALRRALDGIAARHEALRTTFPAVHGQPEQRIAPADAGFALVEHDLSADADPEAALAPLVAMEAGAPFDLAGDAPARGRLVRMGADDHVLLVTLHHVAADGWSLGVFVRELGALYGAFAAGRGDPLPPLPTQYADYAAWQRRWVEDDVLREQADYWMRTLGGAPELLELPTDRPRPLTQDFAGDWMPFALDGATTAALKALGRRHGTTLYMTLLAGWAVVLGRLAGQDDVVIGSPMAGRGRREIEGLIGFFVNTLALRLDVSGGQTVAELLARARARALEAQHHQDIPFEQVVERVDPVRSLAHSPLFQATFAWQNVPGGGGVSIPGLEAEWVGAASAERHSKHDLSLTLWEADGGIAGGVTFAAALFDRDTVERWTGYLGRVLREMAADPARRLDRLTLMSDAERARVVDTWNHTEAPYPADSCLHEPFEAQAARTPHAIALVTAAGERVTYGELNARANRLAHHLRARGVGPDVRVGLCVERGPAMVTGVLAVLKAGGAFVPLDPGYPRERLEYMLADSAPAAVLAQGSVLENVAATLAALGRDVPVLRLDADAPEWADAPETNPDRDGLTPEHPAYVTYTSGSTGRPKGVPSIHHKVLNLVHWYGREMGVTEHDAVLLVMSFSFDGTYRNLFAPLFAGGRLHLAAEPFDPAGIVAQIGAGGIRLVNCTPSAFQALAQADADGALSRLGTAILVGEAVQPRKLLELPEPRPALVNLYGPTECSGIVTFHRMERDLSVYLTQPVPIGGPVSNGRIYLLDGAGQPVPIGVAGELHIGGTPVGRGYQNAPGQTAERFVPDPFGEPGARLYRTGDRARRRADGTLEFLGRMDTQVKVRGYRIEPGEVEARLAAHPAVREAVVLVREDAEGEPRLVAYWLGEPVEAESLRARLAEALPAYMVPAAYVRLEQWPLTSNGKLDRRALPAPDGDAYAARAYEAPADETEEAVAAIWAAVLGVERVGRHDGFFELGGHSLSAVQVVARVRQELEVQVDLADLFTRPVLKDFAQEIMDAQLAQVDPEEMAQLMALLRESAPA